ncbi:MAG: hypothetical protein GY925_15460 [Actinomycetia bacterium]|nr:hypothetical protein [Actinomycetes bacterium]
MTSTTESATTAPTTSGPLQIEDLDLPTRGEGEPVVTAVIVHAAGVEMISGPLSSVEITSVSGAPGREDQLHIPLPRIRSDGLVEYATELPDGSLQLVVVDPLSASVMSTSALSTQPAVMTETALEPSDAGASLVMYREGDSSLQYGIRDATTGQVVWVEDSDFIPLTPHPDGGFLVSGGRVPGSRWLTATGEIIDAGYRGLPNGWSAAFGPNQLLAIGTANSGVIIVEPSGTSAVVTDLPVGSAGDLAWDDSGTVLLVNMAVAFDTATSGVYGCDLTGKMCHKIVDYKHDLRLATDQHTDRFGESPPRASTN